MKSLSVENVKRIEKVVVSPKGFTVKVAGKNAAGKSSLIDAISYLLDGKSAMDEKPIRDRQSKAKIVCDFGRFEITRSIIQKGSTVTVKTEDGKIMSPQTFIDKLLAGAATDVMDFFGKSRKEQCDLFGKIAGVDLGFFDSAITEYEEEARPLRKQLTENRAILGSMDEVPEGTPSEPIDIEALREKQNTAFHRNRLQRSNEEALAMAESRLKKLAQEVQEAEEERARCLKGIDEMAPAEELDMDELDRQIRAADKVNQDVRAKGARDKAKKAVDSAEAMLSVVCENIDSSREMKKLAIESADMPVAGLSMSEEYGVCYKGNPISQISASEKIMVGVALVSKLIPEDGLRVLRVKDASLIDGEGMKRIEEIAEKNAVQVWMELVRDSDAKGDSTIFIQDGRAV